jgi:arylsulfatase A-like enzyme
LIGLLPGGARAGEVRSEPVSLVDLYSTLLAAARIDSGARPQSRDILAPDLAEAPIFAEYYFPLQALGLFNSDSERHRDALAPYMRRLRSVQSDGWRLLWSSDGRLELYNVEQDPTEGVDLAGGTDVETQTTRLGTSLAEFVERGGGRRPLPDAAASSTGAFRDLDPETEQQLRELGYLPAE